jgi:hypothetical protein
LWAFGELSPERNISFELQLWSLTSARCVFLASFLPKHQLIPSSRTSLSSFNISWAFGKLSPRKNTSFPCAGWVQKRYVLICPAEKVRMISLRVPTPVLSVGLCMYLLAPPLHHPIRRYHTTCLTFNLQFQRFQLPLFCSPRGLQLQRFNASKYRDSNDFNAFNFLYFAGPARASIAAIQRFQIQRFQRFQLPLFCSPRRLQLQRFNAL